MIGVSNYCIRQPLYCSVEIVRWSFMYFFCPPLLRWIFLSMWWVDWKFGADCLTEPNFQEICLEGSVLSRWITSCYRSRLRTLESFIVMSHRRIVWSMCDARVEWHLSLIISQSLTSKIVNVELTTMTTATNKPISFIFIPNVVHDFGNYMFMLTITF